MTEKLLPARSRAYTRAAAYTFDTRGRLIFRVQNIGLIGITSFPEDWLPWLIYEYGLEDVAGYLPTAKQALVEGRVWQKIRGTPEAIRIGISWLNITAAVEPPDQRHDWWEFQVRAEKPIHDLETLKRVDAIVKLSSSVEDEMFRIFNSGYDFRPARMDMHQADIGNLADGYSGVRRWEGGPLISFGEDDTEEAFMDEGFLVIAWTELETFEEFEVFDGIRFDVDTDGSRIRGAWQSGGAVDGTVAVLQGGDTWPVQYPRGNWGSGNDITWIDIVEGKNDDATILLADSPDVWPNQYPRGEWANARGPQSIDPASETT